MQKVLRCNTFSVVGCRNMEARFMGIPGMSEETLFKGMNYAFPAGGCSGVMEYWLHTEMEELPEAEQILQPSNALFRVSSYASRFFSVIKQSYP